MRTLSFLRFCFAAGFVVGCCPLVSKKDVSQNDPVGVFACRLGTNLVVSFVNKTERPLYFSLPWKWASYGKERDTEDGPLFLPKDGLDMNVSVPVNGRMPIRLMPFEAALASAPMIINDCRLYNVDLMWWVFEPIPGKEPETFPSYMEDFPADNWNSSLGNGNFSGNVFSQEPLEYREVKHEIRWNNGVFVGDSVGECVVSRTPEPATDDDIRIRLSGECFEIVGWTIGTNIVFSVRNRSPLACSVRGDESNGRFIPEYIARYGFPVGWDEFGRAQCVAYECQGHIPASTNRIALENEPDSLALFSVPAMMGSNWLVQIEIDLHPQWFACSSDVQETNGCETIPEHSSVYFWELRHSRCEEPFVLHKQAWWIVENKDIGNLRGRIKETDPFRDPNASEADLVPFWDSDTGLWGYRDGNGTVRVTPAFTFADDQWHEGFVWVDTERCMRSAHPEWRCELEDSQQDDCGTFIRADGVHLFSFHAHAVADMANDIWDFVPPRFDHGLAFVRFPDGLIRGITTDGNLLPLHARYGGFAFVDIPYQGDDLQGVDPYINYRGDWALVQLTNGWLGVLGADHDFAIGPSANTGMVFRAWRNKTVDRP